MKWSSFLKDLREKVGLSGSSSHDGRTQSAVQRSTSPSLGCASALSEVGSHVSPPRSSGCGSSVSSPNRGTHELELQFRKLWEDFRSCGTEKEKEEALNIAVDIFCILAKHHTNVGQLVSRLEDALVFSFVVGRAFVTDVEKLRICNKERTWNATNIISFFSEVKDRNRSASNLLFAVEVLVTGASTDKQPLLDSGVLCCLIHILKALVCPDENKKLQTHANLEVKNEEICYCHALQVRRLEIEGSVVHIMKALASYPAAASSLTEDDSLQVLFHMVTNGSLTIPQLTDNLVPLHTIQLYRHAMQILSLLLANDNGSTANYIHKHHLINVLLVAVKDFNPDRGDAAYTIGTIDLLLECIELSHRPGKGVDSDLFLHCEHEWALSDANLSLKRQTVGAGSIRLREDIRSAHGYQFLVQFALKLSSLQKNHTIQTVNSKLSPEEVSGSDDVNEANILVKETQVDASIPHLCPALSRLLDVLVNLAQTGPTEPENRKSTGRAEGHGKSLKSFDMQYDEIWETGNNRVKDLEAIQMLQDIFLKAENMELQAEVLNRIFKIFSCHLENYVLCQQLRTVPLLVLNMTRFPPPLQELILKILEYAGTVVNCIPEQELLSLCCLLQQPITSCLKHNILSFFIKILAFDQQYKKVLREVGVLDVLLDDLKQHKFFYGLNQQSKSTSTSEMQSDSSRLNKQVEKTDVMLSSQDSMDACSGKFSIFEDESTTDIGWDFLFSLLSTSETNQQAFRSSAGFNTILPFIVLDNHRPGVLCVLSCLIIEDSLQTYPKELGTIIEILKSGMVTSVSGCQYKLQIAATCDTFGALWRILGSNNSAQRIFGESTGFSLLLTTLHNYRSSEIPNDNSSLPSRMNVFSSLMRAITAGVSNSMINRLRLHTVLSSQTFIDLFCESSLLCMEYEKQVIQLLFDLALETILQPSVVLQPETVSSSKASEDESSLYSNAWNGSSRSIGDRIYNASAISVLLHSLSRFTPQVQLDVLKFIKKLAHAGHFNQENLTSVGCVGLILEAINPFQESSSHLLTHALQIIEVLGAYRLTSSELCIIVRYILQVKVQKSKCLLVNMLGQLICRQGVRSDCASLAPFVEMDMRRFGHASIQVSLGERTWPPAVGYTFVCWFQYQNFKDQVREPEQMPKTGCTKRNVSSGQILRLFSVDTVDDENTFYAKLCLQDNGVFTLATSNACSLSFPDTEIEERRWHHLAVVHNKPNALTGLFQASTAYLYINGKLMQTGKLGYSLSPVGKLLQVTLGIPASHAKINELQWRLRCCYLFEEVLTSGVICFMYILGRGYKGLFQDTDLLRFVPIQACGGGSMAIFDSLEGEASSASSTQKIDGQNKLENIKSHGSRVFWDMEWLMNLSLQLSGKKLIFAFDGTSSEVFQVSGTISLLNLVDPMSAAASLIGGIPHYGYLSGDAYICNQRVIGDSIHTVGGMAIVLALVEAAETRDMLHMSLELLACSLHQNLKNVKDMKILRGYHLLALFLHCKMSLFDMHSLNIFFCIASCQTTFSVPQKPLLSQSLSFSAGISSEASLDDFSLPKFSDDISYVGSHGDLDEFSAQKDSSSHIYGIENTELSEENRNCIFLSNTDMVEHVLLDWTLWVKTPISMQIALLGFLERTVSMHRYRSHNLALLRQVNLLQHLLVTLQCDDVEVLVLEKLVVLLGVILEDGLLPSELDLLVNIITMTFDPPKETPQNQIVREGTGKHVIVRNMLLEMLIGLQITIKAEDLLEQWLNNVSSKLICNFLDETLHPSSMRWIMTLLGVCLSSSSTFARKFRVNGGYQDLSHVLPSFYDSPEIYYILFCLVFGKDVYPRLPEVRMLDFLALLPSDGKYNELKFVDLLEIVISMVKVTFDRLYLQSVLAHQSGNGGLVAELIEATVDMTGDLQGEALMHKTYAARLMGGETGALIAATAILRFMVDLAKTCPPFSSSCKKTEFLESCVDLYFSCIRAGCALKEAKNITTFFQDPNLNVDDESSKSTFSTMSTGNGDSAKTSMIPQEQKSTSLEDIHGSQCYLAGEIKQDGVIGLECLNKDSSVGKMSINDKFLNLSLSISIAPDLTQLTDPLSSSSFSMPRSPNMSEKLNKQMINLDASPVSALPSHIGSTTSKSDTNAKLDARPSIKCIFSLHELHASPDIRSNLHGSSAGIFLPITAELLLEVDKSGYGGGPCSAGPTAVLDFIAEVLADIVLEQQKATQFIENILEAVPMYVDVEAALVFQGLCLGRLLNFLERHLLRDDEVDESKFDKNRWSVNLDSLCWLIVDRVYMRSFPDPLGVFRILEFLFSMLQLANKDGRIEEAEPPGKGILSIARGSKQLESYIYAILKNTNRIIMYCFLPSFLKSIGEDSMLTCLSFQSESGRKILQDESVVSIQKKEESVIDICRILQLIVANKRIILCSINLDIDLISCLCTNLIALLRDKRNTAQNLAVDIIKYLLLHRRPSLEELLVSKSSHGKALDVLHGGFDRLLIGNLSEFFEWLHKYKETINRVLEQCSSVMWVQYVAGSAKFPGVRIKDMEVRRKRELGKKSRDAAKLDIKLGVQITERRATVQLLHRITSEELRVICQDKFGWVLHAESEWHSQVQQLVHERGIFSTQQLCLKSEWQLCPIEGPYRMRKKLERCKLKIDAIQNVVIKDFNLEEPSHIKEKRENNSRNSSSDSDSYFDLLSNDVHDKSFHNGDHEELIKEESMNNILSSGSAQDSWNDDYYSSIYESSLHSATESGAKSSSFSFSITDGVNAKSQLGSPRQVSSMKVDGVRTSGIKQEKELVDNGEYLIRPYLEHSEKIRFKYNCERVVGLDKHDGVFLIGDLCLYVIENFFIDTSGCICEKESEDAISVIDQALGVKGVSLSSVSSEFQLKSTSMVKPSVHGMARAYSRATWGKDKFASTGNLSHPWHMWKLDSIHELLKRDYQLRPVAIEIFSTNGCNDLLVFHKKEREEVFRNLIAKNLPRTSMLDMTISGSSKHERNEGSRLFKMMAKSFSKRWQNGEISNFQYLMHLNTLAGRGYSDLTQYPVFPWILADYESETLDFTNPRTFRKLNKPMGCQTPEGEDEFRKRYESWDDPDIPKFNYGSHYSSAGIVLFYLIRLPPFSTENQKLQGGQFDHADRLFNNIRDTWLSASGKSNTSDVKELIPEFFYLPEFLENRFNLDLGFKQSGEEVGDVVLPPWAKGCTREYIQRHREALESDYVSGNLHHWIDLIFGYKQRGKAAEEAVNVFYHYTYEGNVDIDSVSDPTMKASILAQINHFGQTPKQLFRKPHVKRRNDRKFPRHPLNYSGNLVPEKIHHNSSAVFQIVIFNERILVVGLNSLLKPVTFSKYISWGFPDRSLRIMSYDQDKLLSTHENLHGGNQIQCAGLSHDGQFLVTGSDDGAVAVWRFGKGVHADNQLTPERTLCAHSGKITCLHVSQPYSLIITGSEDCSVIIWDLTNLVFVKQLPLFPAPISSVHVNGLTGEILTAAGILLAVWSINGDCLAMVNTSQVPPDMILCVTTATHSDWQDTNWFVTGHQSGAVKVWKMVHCPTSEGIIKESPPHGIRVLDSSGKTPEYKLVLHQVLNYHKYPVTALHLPSHLKQLLSGDGGGNLLSWTLPDNSTRTSKGQGSSLLAESAVNKV